MLIKLLLRIARAVVSQVSRSILQQINVVEDQVRSPLTSAMQPLLDGAWVGDGADAFFEEVNTRVLPQITAIVESASGFNINLLSALDILDQADNQARNIVNNLVDTFNSIF